jgi:hypothetical protein
LSQSGTGTFKVDGNATQAIDRTMPITRQWNESFDIGTGKIDKLTTAVDPPKLTPEDMKKLEAAYRVAQDAN